MLSILPSFGALKAKSRFPAGLWQLSLAVFGVFGSFAPSARGHDVIPLSRAVELVALLDGAQIVRPPAFQPPAMGTGSSATGRADLAVDTSTGEFFFHLAVQGIDPTDLDRSFGANGTAVHLHVGRPGERGPMLLDLHHFARLDLPESDGVLRVDGGFEMGTSSTFASKQGDFETAFTPAQFVDAVTSENIHIVVHSTTNQLFRAGEIRGNFSVLPERIELIAELDGEQVVRPEAFRPPLKGSGSTAEATAQLILYPHGGYFLLELEVQGIAAEDLDNSIGPNSTALHIHVGDEDSRGPVIVDVHDYARSSAPGTNGIEPTEDGFRLRTKGVISERQGEFDTQRSVAEIVDAIRLGRSFMAIHSTTNELFRTGEIRGQFRVVPDEFEVSADLDGQQVVRPPEFQPPRFGSGSEARGTFWMRVQKTTGRFESTLEVEGIDPEALDNFHGSNETAIQLHWGFPETRGPIIVDLHHFARASNPDSDGIVVTESGFRLESEGYITRIQGEHDTQFGLAQILGFIRGGDAFVSVATTTEPLFLGGEIRGNVEISPPLTGDFRLESSLSGASVVRPVEFQPPLVGSGSEASGAATLAVDIDDARFQLRLEVDGIDPDDLDATHGENETAVQILLAPPNENGKLVLDVHHFARISRPATDGIVRTKGGFLLEASGPLRQAQGAVDTGFTYPEIIDALQTGDRAYIVVYTESREIYSVAGEVRGVLARSRTSPPRFLRGDCNGDGRFVGQVADAVFLLTHNFRGGPRPVCLAACDANGDGDVIGQVTDAVYMLMFNFLGGPAPQPPYPECGDMPITETLGCEKSIRDI